MPARDTESYTERDSDWEGVRELVDNFADYSDEEKSATMSDVAEVLYNEGYPASSALAEECAGDFMQDYQGVEDRDHTVSDLDETTEALHDLYRYLDNGTLPEGEEAREQAVERAAKSLGEEASDFIAQAKST